MRARQNGRGSTTDLNAPCLEQILTDVAGHTSVLDVGCGSGFLAGRLRQVVPEVVGVDFKLDPAAAARHRDIDGTLREIRRVARHSVILVVPRERPYRRTLNLHLHFFPYVEAFLLAVRPPPSHWCGVLGGDIYYRETPTRS